MSSKQREVLHLRPKPKYMFDPNPVVSPSALLQGCSEILPTVLSALLQGSPIKNKALPSVLEQGRLFVLLAGPTAFLQGCSMCDSVVNGLEAKS